MDALNLILALILAKIKDASSSIANIIDTTLTISGKAADAKITGDKIEEVKEDLLPISNEVVSARTNSNTGTTYTDLPTRLNTEHAELSEAINALYGGVPTPVRAALNTLAAAAYYGEVDVTAELATVAAWAAYTSAIVLDQSAITISGASTVQLTATTTPAGNTVSWASSDTSVATVDSNGLVTGVGNGVATITATSGDIYATCTATVSGFAELTSISAAFAQGDNKVYLNTALADLEQYLTVTGTYDDSSTRTLTGYTLSGTLTAGTSTVTVTYGEFTTTFSVTVEDCELVRVLTSDDIVYTGNLTVMAPNYSRAAGTSMNRAVYPPFDTPFEYGYTYTIDAETSLASWAVYAQGYNTTAYAAVQNSQTFSVNDQGDISGSWINNGGSFTYSEQINGKDVVCMRFGFAADGSSHSTEFSGGEFTSVTITRKAV